MPGSKPTLKEQIKTARKLEKERDFSAAIKAYKAAIAAAPLHPEPYNRLMIIYRKQKKYQAELSIIRQAIAAYEKELKEDLETRKKQNRKSLTISSKLARSLGLLNNKGLPVYEDPQVIRWRERAAVVRKRMESAEKRRKATG